MTGAIGIACKGRNRHLSLGEGEWMLTEAVWQKLRPKLWLHSLLYSSLVTQKPQFVCRMIMAASVPASPEGRRRLLTPVPHWCTVVLGGSGSCGFVIGFPSMRSWTTKHPSSVWRWFLGSLPIHPSWGSNLPTSVFQKWKFCKLKYLGRQLCSPLYHQHHGILKYSISSPP